MLTLFAAEVEARSSFYGLTGTVIVKAAKGSSVQSSRFLKVDWNPILGAQEYDLEWTTIDDISGDRAALFRNNATRVTLSNALSYSIPLVSTEKYIAVRIRHASYNEENVRVENGWEYVTNNNTYAHWQIDAAETSLNWQLSTSYAEDGKRKDVISYFDGALRNRQTVTISDTIAVVQENVYDEFGRTVASVLPAPVKDVPKEKPFLHFYPNFNQNSLGNPYSFKDIDLACDIKPSAMKGGASSYYSSENQFLSDPLFANKNNFTKYIPDAGGYPFSVTQYTADKTGRVKQQGGVGAKFQPGFDGGRVTQYFYSRPSQHELDRLFGSDAGLAKYHTKNTVIDPNGQISISYVNSSGKTVATALAGKTPDNLAALESNTPTESKVVSLITPDQFVYQASELRFTANATYIVNLDTEVDLIYNISRLTACAALEGHSLCQECKYTFTINVRNCGQKLFNYSVPVNATNPATGDIALAIPGGLKAGEYDIQMVLALDEKDANDYAVSFIKDGQTAKKVKTKLDLIKVYLNKIDLSTFGGCESCMELLGEKVDFIDAFYQKLDAMGITQSEGWSKADIGVFAGGRYDDLREECALSQANCPKTSPCFKYATLMEQDLSPGGQYALFDENYSLLGPDKYNMLSDEMWRKVFPVKQPGDPTYTAFSFVLDNYIESGDGSTNPVNDGPQRITSPFDASFNVSMRIKYWKPEWASLFLKYHPEYCKLQFCKQNESVFHWANHVSESFTDVESTVGISGSTTNKYTHSNPLWLLEFDPFFKADGLGKDYRDEIQADLEHYSTNVLQIPEYYRVSEKSVKGFIDFLLYCNDQIDISDPDNIQYPQWDECESPVDSDPCRVKDREWDYYKTYYLGLRDKYVKKYREDQGCNPGFGDCKLGIAQTMPQPGEVQVGDFFIRKADSLDPCTSGQQRLSIIHQGGKLSSTYVIDVYYPGLSIPMSVVMEAGTSSVSICVPVSIKYTNVKVSDVILKKDE